MNKSVVYFAQLTHEKEGVYQNNHIPLAIGLLSEFLKKDLDENVLVKLFKTPSDLNDSLLKENPSIVFFSLYMWNENLSLQFAKEIKKQNPGVLIVMGGPNISLIDEKNIDFLTENNFVDILVRGDGETLVREIAKKYYESKNIDKVKRITTGNIYSIIDGKPFIFNDEKDIKLGMKGNGELNEIPSPYLSGALDKFFTHGAIPLLETNRGCPFSCAFCQQGNKYFSRIRNYDTKRVQKEIEYIAKKIHEEKLKITILEMADANFAMYKRDGEFLDFVRIMQDKYSFPKEIWCSTGKNRTSLIVDNINKLQEGSILMRAAVQSVDKNTLEAIKRKNIKLETYFDFMDRYEKQGLATGADVMLGLPMESKSVHVQGFLTLIDKKITEFSALQTIQLKGTEMEKPEFINQYGIKTKFRVIPESHGEYNIYDSIAKIYECEKIIYQTNDLSFEDYLDCREFHFLLMVYHNTRLALPVYKVLDFLGINRSELLRVIYSLSHSSKELTKDFIIDTQKELLEDERVNFSKDEIEILTSNKIFRHLAVSLYKKQDMILSLLKEALLLIVKEDIVDDLLVIVKDSLLCIFSNDYEAVEKQIENKTLQKIFGNSFTAFVSKEQQNNIVFLKNTYIFEDDIINNIMYHLRPKNAVKTMSFMR
jgi:radical SAM superfamily enzyme YgiQ (UPF0313 family)